MNKDFREFLKDELYKLYKVKKLNEGMLIGYGEGVYDTYAYVLKKYDEFHKPVVVPDFVAEWIESPDRDLDDMYAWERPENVYKWTFGEGDSLENSRLKDLIDAIDNGYEVVEPLFYVKMTGILEGENFVNLRKPNGVYTLSSKDSSEHYQTQFTQEEVDKIPWELGRDWEIVPVDIEDGGKVKVDQ